MGLVQDNEVRIQLDAGVHGVVELVAQNFGGADDDGGVGLLPPIPRQDTHLVGAEEIAEFLVLGVAEGLQGAGVPGPAALFEDPPDGLLRNPGLAGARGRRDQAVAVPDGRHGFKLVGVRLEGRFFGNPDLGEDRFQAAVRPGLYLGFGFVPSAGTGAPPSGVGASAH